MAEKRRKGRGKLLLRDLEFEVQEGILLANIADPAGMKEYVERHKHVPCAEFHWWLRIDMKKLAIESKIDDEIEWLDWKPAIYDTHLVLPRMSRWIELAGQEKTWDSPYDPKSGIPNGGFYVWEHENIPKATLRFVERAGCRFRVHWKGSCDVFWDEKYNDQVPFELDAWVQFTEVRVAGSWRDNDNTIRERLARYLDPADFVQKRIKKSKIKFDYGTRTVTDSILRPRPNIRTTSG